jgi:ferric-dicitrate binding protein FerR (iron transport regulator)
MSDPLSSLRRLGYQPDPARWQRLAAEAARQRRVRRLTIAAGALAAAVLMVGLVSRVFVPVVGLPARLVGASGEVRAVTLTRQWFETGTSESMTVQVADIGAVRVEAGSRVRLKETGPAQHRLELEAGTLHARVDAPPRLFVVDTPHSTAIDLGCAYTLTVTDAGSTLAVTSGLVALAEAGREVTVLAGMRAMASKGRPPSTPVSLEAPEAFQVAVARVDASRDEGALREVLAQATVADAPTLWHLLSVVQPPQRADVGAALGRLIAPPPEWKAETNDARALDSWWTRIVEAR